jgi:hypothetical protein
MINSQSHSCFTHILAFIIIQDKSVRVQLINTVHHQRIILDWAAARQKQNREVMNYKVYKPSILFVQLNQESRRYFSREETDHLIQCYFLLNLLFSQCSNRIVI